MLSVLLVFIGFSSLSAADFYWVGGPGNWSDPMHWATTSGGATNYAGYPGSADNVLFDDNSSLDTGGTIVINVVEPKVKNMDWRGLTTVSATPVLQADISIGHLEVHGSLWLTNTMQLSVNAPVEFHSLLPGQEIQCGGNSFNRSVELNGIGGEWTLQDDFATSPSYPVLVTRGSLITNGKTLDIGAFGSSGSTVRSVDIRNSVIHLRDDYRFVNGSTTVSGPWNTSTTSNMTFLSDGSNIEFNNLTSSANLVSNGIGFDKVAGKVSTTTLNIWGNSQFHCLSFEGNGEIRDDNQMDLLILQPGRNLTLHAGFTQDVDDIQTQVPATCENRTRIVSSSCVASATLDLSNAPVSPIINLDYLILGRVNAVNGAISATNVIDEFGASGWTLNSLSSPQTFYWVGGQNNLSNNSNWHNPENWSTVSGQFQTGGTCVPSLVDAVIFDAGSFTSTANLCDISGLEARCGDMTWSGVGNMPIFRNKTAGGTLSIHGNLEFDTSMRTELELTTFFLGSSSHTIRMNGQKFSNSITFNHPDGEWVLQDALYIEDPTDIRLQGRGGHLTLSCGTLRTNDQDVRAVVINSSFTTRRALYLGSSYVNVVGRSIGNSFYTWHFSTFDSLTFDAGTSTIELDNIRTSLGVYHSHGQAFYNVHFSNPNTEVAIYGNNTFNKLTLAGNGTFGRNFSASKSSNSMDTLSLSAGKYYNFATNKTQSVGHLIAQGNCIDRILLQSQTPGVTTIWRPLVSGGTISGDGLVVKDVLGTSGTLIGTNSVEVGLTSGWTINTGASQNFFWVGGDGDWSDIGHWSLSSGGTPQGCLPGPNDDVYFDAMSGFSSGDAVRQDLSVAYCRNMDWTGALNTPEFDLTTVSDLRIFGGYTFIAGMSISYNNQTQTYLDANSGTHNLTQAGQYLPQIIFNGPGGTWNLADPLSCSILYMNQGILNTMNEQLDIRHFSSGTAQARTINLGSSLVQVHGSSTSNNSTSSWRHSGPLTFNAGTSLIRFTGSSLPTIYGGGLDFYDVEFSDPIATARIYFGNTFHDANFLGHAQLKSSNQFFSLHFAGGKSYELQAGSTQTIDGNGNFDALGTITDLIEITSSSVAAQCTLRKDFGMVCLNYIQMRNCYADDTGGAIYFAGPNSDNIENNDHWSFDFCSPPVFTVCDGEAISYDEFNLGIGAWDWNFGDPLSGAANASSLPDPDHVFSGPGSYSVLVDVDLLNTRNRIYSVVNVLPAPVGAVSPSGPLTICLGDSVELTASGGLSYDWSIGATSPSIFVSDSGSYTVTVTGANGCADSSNTVVVDTVLCQPPPMVDLGPDTLICDLGSGFLLDATNPPNVMATYLWSTGATSPTINVTLSGTYSVTVSNAAGSVSDTIDISFSDLGITTSGCHTIFIGYGPGTCSPITVTPSGGTGPYTYLWSNGVTYPAQSVLCTQTTTYSVTVTDANGCQRTDAVIVNVVNVSCGPNGNDVEICYTPISNPNAQQTLCVPTGDVAGYLNNPSGEYQLGACGVNDPCNPNAKPAEVASQLNAWSLQAWPNPVASQLKLEIDSGDHSGNARVRVYDLLGNQVYQQQLEIQNGQISRQIDLSKLSAQVLFLEVVFAGELKVIKLVKQ